MHGEAGVRKGKGCMSSAVSAAQAAFMLHGFIISKQDWTLHASNQRVLLVACSLCKSENDNSTRKVEVQMPSGIDMLMFRDSSHTQQITSQPSLPMQQQRQVACKTSIHQLQQPCISYTLEVTQLKLSLL